MASVRARIRQELILATLASLATDINIATLASLAAVSETIFIFCAAMKPWQCGKGWQGNGQVISPSCA
jgi:hypothetical protein